MKLRKEWELYMNAAEETAATKILFKPGTMNERVLVIGRW